MNLYHKLKLYRIKSAYEYALECKEYSAKAKELAPHKNQFLMACDIFLCWAKYGYNFNDWCSFEFWDKDANERNKYISYRQNNELIPKISTKSIYNAFNDKREFLKLFPKWQKREVLSLPKEMSVNEKIKSINAFLQNHKEGILKPVFDYGGAGVIKIKAPIILGGVIH